MRALVAAALVGTARQTSLPATGSAVDPLIAALPGSSAERRLLLAAGADAVHRQAGAIPPRRALPAPCEPEPLRPVGGVAATLLASIGDESHLELIPEACALLARARRRLPASLLPRFLDLKEPALRAALLPVLGARARWLAAFNPAWRWVLEADLALRTALPDDADTIWQEAAPAQRLAVLTLARAVEPERARTWLAATWKSERAEQRADFLAALATNLTPDDEPFLEAALDDRGERVRERAGGLLSTLPASAFTARMVARAPALLTYNAPGLLKHRSGLIVPGHPQEIDQAWQRDLGIAKLPTPLGEADRAGILTQTLACIPLSHWTRLFGRDPETLVAAATAEPEVIAGWSRAAIAQRDAGWAGPLWGWWRDHDGQNPQIRYELLQGLLAVLPSDHAGALLAHTFAQHGDSMDATPWTGIIHAQQRPWSVELSTACLAALRRFLANLQPNMYPANTFWYQILPTIAAGIAPSCLAGAEEPFDLPSQATAIAWQAQQWQHALQSFGKTIALRRRLYRELPA